MVLPQPNEDAIGPSKRHPEATEIAFYKIMTAMVCFVAAAVFPLVMSRIQMLAKKVAEPIAVEKDAVAEEEGVEMKPWARSRSLLGVAGYMAHFVINYHLNTGPLFDTLKT